MPVDQQNLDRDALMKELGAPQSTFDTFKESHFDPRNKDEDVLKSAYSQFTGREADPEGLAAHLKNPGGLEGGVRAIYASPESQAYGRANPEAWGNQPRPGDTTGFAPPTSNTMPVKDPTDPTDPTVPAAGAVAPARTPTQASVFQGFTPKYAMEGFNFGREQNTGKSAKDAFAYLANQAPPPPINDKAALGKWAEQYIVPGMKDLGHDVSNVQGDKFHLKNWQGDFDVDYGRGAGAEGGALAWQVDDPTAKLSNAAYTPKAPSGADAALAAAIGGGGAGGVNAAQREALLKEIEALVSGGTTPMDKQALTDQLQG